MVRGDSRRPKAFFILGLVLVVGACTDLERTPAPIIPTLPSPVPSPEPSPEPSPSPAVSTSGITMEVRHRGSHECKRGIGPSAEGLRVGCSVEVRATFKDAGGNKPTERRTGNDMTWRVVEGPENVTLPWDENPWNRWLTGVAPGPYRIVATLALPEGEEVKGELEGTVVP